MLKKQRKLILFIILLLVLITLLFLESYKFEFHKIIIAIIGIGLALLIMQIISSFELYASKIKILKSNLVISRFILITTIVFFVLMIDKIILIVANYYNKQYSSIWTIMIPCSFLIGYVLKNLDVWAFENEKNKRV